MTNPAHHEHERESLSALFDGELQGDAARFALKRFEHDREWREACGRWQLAGDVLRGRATVMAPAGFAGRVAAALEEAPVAAAATMAGTGSGARNRRRWAGGAALAASVALAALFVSRPAVSPAPDVPPATPLAASPAIAPLDSSGSATPPQVAAITEATPAERPADTLQSGSSLQPPAPAIALAGTAVAVAEAPRRAAVRRARAEAATTAAIREANHAQPGEPQAVLAAAEPLDTDAADPRPFLPPGEIATRPWPRATLPGYPRGSFTASFGDTDTPSPSFYPFEPERLEVGVSGDASTSAWPRD